MKTDYQLRHQLFGRLGSLWSRQVDSTTKTRARNIVAAAGNAPTLRRLEVAAAGTLAQGKVAVEDATFRFVDGDFAFVGQSQTDYTHVTAHPSDDGEITSLALRDSSGATVETLPTPTSLAALTADFLRLSIGAEETLQSGCDWYLIPVPEELTPTIIVSKDGDHLVSGIDFSAHKGYIATRENPATVFPSGIVRVASGMLEVTAPNSYVMGAPVVRKCGKYLAEYMRKTQSLDSFCRAAAEYCGMFVFQEADVVLASISVPGGAVYVMAGAGPVRIDYLHTPLAAGQEIQPGHIVSARLEIATEATHPTLDFVASDTGEDISLDGVLPIKGLSWTPRTRVLADYVEVAIGGTPHLRLHFNGSEEALQALWDTQRRHELATGVYLYDEIAQGAESLLVDVGALLQSYYGPQLVLLVANVPDAQMYDHLMEFVNDCKPAGVALLTSVIGSVPDNALLDENGDPVLDEFGNYILSE